MDDNLTIPDLKKRWEKLLIQTKISVARHPVEYRQIKSIVHNIINNPLDIKEYLPTVKKLTYLFEVMDENKQETIFSHFNERIRPSQIWQIDLLRVECRDLLDHLHTFDKWRREYHQLKIIK